MEADLSAARKKRVLHVGCGQNEEVLYPGFRTPKWQEIWPDIDPAVHLDLVANINSMPEVADNSMDAVWSAHSLEHLYAHQVLPALKEFFRVLVPGGFLFFVTPDMLKVAEFFAQGKFEEPLYDSPRGSISAIDLCFGHRASIAKSNQFMAHKTGFTIQSIIAKLQEGGFENLAVSSEDGYILQAIGYKPKAIV